MTMNLTDESQGKRPVCQLQPSPQNVQNYRKRQRTKEKMKEKGETKRKSNIVQPHCNHVKAEISC